jgi:glycosyltransferase involved in cell wall biosynthesis
VTAAVAIRAIHTVGSLGFSAGGPSRTVPALCRHVAADDPSIQVEIVTTRDARFGPNVPCRDVEFHAVDSDAGRRAIRQLLEDRVVDAKTAAGTVLLHDHGQWLPLNRFSAAAARRHRLKRIVSPRGMLTPWALNHKRLPKKIAWLLFGRSDFLTAALLHATSQQEADEFRALGARQPIALIPNGVDHHDQPPNPPDKTRTMLFLSRLHPKKGVAELVAAWRAVRPAGWRLVLAGPDEARMLDSLQLCAADTITYVGEVDGDEKWCLLRSAAVTVLPSYSENFGVVVAESLMAGTPAIATLGTPWQSLEELRCGWWIPMTADSLQCTIRAATATDLEALTEMGRRGRDHAITSFTWPAIGAQMTSVYRWLAGSTGMPASIQLA